MKSQDQIRERLLTQKKDEFNSLMWQASTYHPLQHYLPEYMKEGYEPTPLTQENLIADMAEYMPFAIEKAEDQRGLSATRSIWKFQQWLWALDDELLVFKIGEYDDYGLKNLHEVADKYHLPLKEESK